MQLSAAAPVLLLETSGEQIQLSQTLQVPTRDQIQLSQPLQVPTSPAPTGNLLGFNAFNSSMQVAPQSNLTFISDFSVDVKPAWTQGNGCLPLAERECFAEQSKSFGDCWSGVLGTINTILSGVVSLEHFCFQSASSHARGRVHGRSAQKNRYSDMRMAIYSCFMSRKWQHSHTQKIPFKHHAPHTWYAPAH